MDICCFRRFAYANILLSTACFRRVNFFSSCFDLWSRRYTKSLLEVSRVKHHSSVWEEKEKTFKRISGQAFLLWAHKTGFKRKGNSFSSLLIIVKRFARWTVQNFSFVVWSGAWSRAVSQGKRSEDRRGRGCLVRRQGRIWEGDTKRTGCGE